MENKTCGECRFFETKEFICCHSGDEVAEHFIACSEFEPKPTNGDIIRQMNNSNKFCVNCLYHIRTAITPCGSDFCKKMRNPVTGNPTPCMWVRSNPDMCGKEGRYFEKKEPAPKKTNFWFRIFRGKR